LGFAVACSIASGGLLAATPIDAGNGANKGLQRSAFVRGDAASMVKRHKAPKTEREAAAAKQVVAPGIVAAELPEDRMVNLVRVTRPDGSIAIGHEAADAAPAPAAPAKEIARD
jgi:hypothetical protein